MTQFHTYDYDEAFSRNIGWVTEWEQQILRCKKIAIAGMGGVGGIHLLTLARLGVENFNIADYDVFELANFNRQVGAMTSTINKSKTTTLTLMARDINPGIKIHSFDKGIDEATIDDFLKDVDLFVDGLDFYVLDIRRKVFKRCAELKIPAITAGPLGAGVGYMMFMPNEMTFDEYFCFDNNAELNQVKFLIGINPSASQGEYLIDSSKLNFEKKRAPSMIMGCNFCAGIVATEALKVLLKRGTILSAPWYQNFDPYLNRFTQGYLSEGNKNWIQSIRIQIVNKFFIKRKHKQIPKIFESSTTLNNDLERILDLAKWTPSGDNSQPWQFEIKNDHEVLVNYSEEKSVYDYAEKPAILTVGFFIENFKIAAAHFGYRIDWNYHHPAERTHLIQFKITPDSTVTKSDLVHFLKIRSVNRFPYQSKQLTNKEKQKLEQTLSDNLKIHWFESFPERLTFANITATATHIRMSIPEAYPTHKRLIDFENDFSQSKVPVKSLGVIPPIQKLMKFGLASAQRINFLNTFLGAAIFPQIEMDYLPGIFCSAHFLVEWKKPADIDNPHAILSAGQDFQRFWLEATKLGLVMQPCFAPLAFSYYAKNNIPFTQKKQFQKQALKLCAKVEKFAPANNLIFLGRIGHPRSKLLQPRSVRKDLSELIKH